MKLITEIKKEYHQDAPDLYSLREKNAFYNNASDDLYDKTGGFDQMTKEQKEEWRLLREKSNSRFDFFAPAKDIEKWIKQVKKNHKDFGYEKVKVVCSLFSKAHGFDASNQEFETNRHYHSTARLSFPVSMKQLKEWATEGSRYEAAKLELGHEEKKCGHSVMVSVYDDTITIWLN